MTNPPSADLSAPPASAIVIRSSLPVYAAHASGSRMETANCYGSKALLHSSHIPSLRAALSLQCCNKPLQDTSHSRPTLSGGQAERVLLPQKSCERW